MRNSSLDVYGDTTRRGFEVGRRARYGFEVGFGARHGFEVGIVAGSQRQGFEVG